MTTEGEMQHKQGGDMDAQLEDILEAYAAAEPGPSRSTLTAWIREYPQFARELTDFTARWQLLEWAGDPINAEEPHTTSGVTAEEEDRLILRGMSAAQSVFYAKRAPQPAAQVGEAGGVPPQRAARAAHSDARIDSLTTAASRSGLTYAALRERVDLSDALLQKLNRRLIDPLTVPNRVLAELAAALQQRVEVVAAYLALPPTFAAGAQHRASQAPTLPKVREDFFDAVRNDAVLSDTRKQELLALLRGRPSDTSR